MTASHAAEVEALLVRLEEMRRSLLAMGDERSRLEEDSSLAEDLYSAEQALLQAEKLLRRVRASLQ